MWAFSCQYGLFLCGLCKGLVGDLGNRQGRHYNWDNKALTILYYCLIHLYRHRLCAFDNVSIRSIIYAAKRKGIYQAPIAWIDTIIHSHRGNWEQKESRFMLERLPTEGFYPSLDIGCGRIAGYIV